MRWNCPHCGVALAVSDEKLGTGWSFSRCFKCGGFALVRRADINLIKVDKAPTGEKVILPESSEEPRLSQEATKHLSQITKAAKIAPAIRPASNRKPQATPPVFKPEVQAAKVDNKTEMALPNFPEPLPEQPERTFRNRMLPMAIGLAGFAAISSGVYLYVQGQRLWQEARTAALTEGRSNPIRQTSLTNVQTAPTVASTADVVDTVHHNAMAPVRNEEPTRSAMIIRATTRASLRSGPGLNYDVLGVANPEARYVVKEWKERWFHVVLPEAEQNMSPAGKPTTAWIRNDLVEQVSTAQ